MTTQTVKTQSHYGTELILDLVDCDIDIITSGSKLQEFAHKLCEVIEMRPYGEPFVKRFALDVPKSAGYTLVQLIETSSITAHFSELWKKAYVNIFSCKKFDTKKAREFTQAFFHAKIAKETILVR